MQSDEIGCAESLPGEQLTPEELDLVGGGGVGSGGSGGPA
jgi:hypothetical protein